MNISDIIKAIKDDRIRITDNADEEAKADCLTYDEIFFAVNHGEIIERYPQDKPYPSCLILGFTFAGLPVHSVWAYNPANGWAVLVTVYWPNPDLWINWKTRRKNETFQ
ncbi:MAG: DUF4258 domain-containing protein [Candidatus Edwardsbacteria bacterium]|nr:DUF4258 domain-containing protein [Candidatus Edwardsbacteria bacterium]